MRGVCVSVVLIHLYRNSIRKTEVHFPTLPLSNTTQFAGPTKKYLPVSLSHSARSVKMIINIGNWKLTEDLHGGKRNYWRFTIIALWLLILNVLRIKQRIRCIKYPKLYFFIELYMFRASSVPFIRSHPLYTRQLVRFMQVILPLPNRVRLDEIKFWILMHPIGCFVGRLSRCTVPWTLSNS
jgi:hypothetical protein